MLSKYSVRRQGGGGGRAVQTPFCRNSTFWHINIGRLTYSPCGLNHPFASPAYAPKLSYFAVCAGWAKSVLSLFVAVDASSASELSDNDSDDSDSRELTSFSCCHCYTTSKYKHYIITQSPRPSCRTFWRQGPKWCRTAMGHLRAKLCSEFIVCKICYKGMCSQFVVMKEIFSNNKKFMKIASDILKMEILCDILLSLFAIEIRCNILDLGDGRCFVIERCYMYSSKFRKVLVKIEGGLSQRYINLCIHNTGGDLLAYLPRKILSL